MINSYVALDIETTGLNPARDKIIEIGMAKVVGGAITESYKKLFKPNMKLPERIVELTGINDDMLSDEDVIDAAIGEIVEFIGDYPILGHNVIFDYSFLKKAAVNNNLTINDKGIDTLKIARRVLPELEHKNLDVLCEHFNIDPGHSHRAYDDAVSASCIYMEMYKIKPEDSGFEFPIQLIYNAKKDSPITAAQIKYLSALALQHGVTFSTPIDKMTKSEASRNIDNILSEFGR